MLERAGVVREIVFCRFVVMVLLGKEAIVEDVRCKNTSVVKMTVLCTTFTQPDSGPPFASARGRLEGCLTRPDGPLQAKATPQRVVLSALVSRCWTREGCHDFKFSQVQVEQRKICVRFVFIPSRAIAAWGGRDEAAGKEATWSGDGSAKRTSVKAAWAYGYHTPNIDRIA